MNGAWPIFSHVFYLVPVWECIHFARARRNPIMYLRVTVLLALIGASTYYHACAVNGCSDDMVARARDGDHVMAIFTTGSLVLLFLPLSRNGSWLEVVLHLPLFAGACLAVLLVDLDSDLAFLWAALVVIGALLLSLAALRWIFCIDVVRYADLALKRQIWSVRVLALSSLAVSLALWFVPQLANDTAAHGGWHVATATAATALIYLAETAREQTPTQHVNLGDEGLV